MLYVDLTEAADGTLSVNKTLAEIGEAYEDGKDVLLRTAAGALVPLFSYSANVSAAFMFTYATEDATSTTTYTVTKTKVTNKVQTSSAGAE